MKTLLISPPIYHKTKYGRSFFRTYAPPIGLAYISAALKRQGLQARVIDAINYSRDDMESLIRSEAPDIVGISCFTEQRRSTFMLADIVKTVNRDILVVVGGVHASFMREQILKHYPSVDIIVIGEGEAAFCELVKVLSAGAKIGSVSGISYREKGEIVTTPERPQISDLDSLPFPDFRDLDHSLYDVYAPIRSLDIKGKDNRPARHASINTSRGCVGRCQFCSVHGFWKSSWRSRSAASVADEIEILAKENGVKFINFTDDIFTVKKERVIEICREILRRDIRISWDCETRVDFISREMLFWMKSSGCVSVAFGIESGSPLILNGIDKKTEIERIRESVSLARDEGIKVNILLMVGNPGESDETISQTIRLMEDVKPDIRTVQITSVYPGSPLYDYCKTTGSLTDDYWLTDRPAPFYTKEATVKQLKIWQDALLINTSSSRLEKALRRAQGFIDRNFGVRVTLN